MKTLSIIILIITLFISSEVFIAKYNYNGIACIARIKYVLVFLHFNLKFFKIVHGYTV